MGNFSPGLNSMDCSTVISLAPSEPPALGRFTVLLIGTDAGPDRSHALTDTMEPGSTFKVFTLAAALETGAVKLTDRIFCENGSMPFQGGALHDVHPNGLLTVAGGKWTTTELKVTFSDGTSADLTPVEK